MRGICNSSVAVAPSSPLLLGAYNRRIYASGLSPLTLRDLIGWGFNPRPNTRGLPTNLQTSTFEPMK